MTESERLQAAEEKLARLEVLLKVSSLMNSTPDPAKALKGLLREVVKITRATSGSIAMLDRERGVLDIVSAINIAPRAWKKVKLQLGVGITGWVAYTGKPVRANDVRRNSHYVQIKPDVRSELAVPLNLDGRVIGVINVDSREKNAFSEVDEDLLVAVANHSARIVETARLHETARRHAQELESLFAFGQSLIRPLPEGGLVRAVVEQGRRLARAKFCLIALHSPGNPDLVVRAVSGNETEWPADLVIDAETSLLGRVLKTGQPSHCPDILHAGLQFQELAMREGVASMLAVPVLYQDRTQGILATYYDRVHEPEDREIRALQLLAGQFAVALENADRYDRILAMEEGLRRAERFSLLGGLAAEIAHDIRNPVTIINMLLHPICESVSDPVHQRDLGIVMEKLELINRIVEQTLELARSSEINLEPVAINDLLNDLLTFLRYKIDQSGVRLQTRLDPSNPVAPADRGQIQQVFLNLLLNAIQATASGGTLTIRTAVRKDEDEGSFLVVGVADTGVGIPEAEQELVFEPFYTTRPEGTGLGLFISRKIVANHGGRIVVRSSPGKGSTFSVWLPLARDRNT